jgi:antitoxin ParD1/3/4
MSTMNLALSDAAQDWVEQQAQNDRYDTPADYVRDLIERDRVRHAKIRAMQKLVDEAIASGPGNRTMAELLEEAQARAGVSRGV